MLAVDGQRNVGASGMLAGERPFGLAVADDVEFQGHRMACHRRFRFR